MKKLLINGPIVDDSDAFFYEWWGDPFTSPKVVRNFLKEANGEDIQVSINSGGGSVFAGSEIFTELQAYTGKVNVVVTGLAASIASVIMLAGDTIKASPIAQIMIHNASMHIHGDHRDLEHYGQNLKDTSLSIADMYAQKMGISQDEVKQLMDGETWYQAKQAVEVGLIDEVLMDSIPQFVNSGSHIVSKEKIMEFKAMLERKSDSSLGMSELKDSIRTIVADEIRLALDNQHQDVTLGDLSRLKQESTPMSPFARFI